jgi:hypothetical protein
MGKACLRFPAIEDVPLDVIGDIVTATPVDDCIRTHEASRKR